MGFDQIFADFNISLGESLDTRSSMGCQLY